MFRAEGLNGKVDFEMEWLMCHVAEGYGLGEGGRAGCRERMDGEIENGYGLG